MLMRSLQFKENDPVTARGHVLVIGRITLEMQTWEKRDLIKLMRIKFASARPVVKCVVMTAAITQFSLYICKYLSLK